MTFILSLSLSPKLTSWSLSQKKKGKLIHKLTWAMDTIMDMALKYPMFLSLKNWQKKMWFLCRYYLYYVFFKFVHCYIRESLKQHEFYFWYFVKHFRYLLWSICEWRLPNCSLPSVMRSQWQKLKTNYSNSDFVELNLIGPSLIIRVRKDYWCHYRFNLT